MRESTKQKMIVEANTFIIEHLDNNYTPSYDEGVGCFILTRKDIPYQLDFTLDNFRRIIRGKKTFTDRFQKVISNINNNYDETFKLVEFTSLWTNFDDKFVKLKHTKCGHVWNTSPAYISSGFGCPNCRGGIVNESGERILKGTENMLAQLPDFIKNYETIDTFDINYEDKQVYLINNRFGYHYKYSFRRIKEFIEGKATFKDSIQEHANKLHDKGYSIVSFLENDLITSQHIRMIVQHDKCGEVINIDDISELHKLKYCPNCEISNEEKNLVATNTIPFIVELRKKIPKFIKKRLNDEYTFELDIENRQVILNHKENGYSLDFSFRVFSDYLSNNQQFVDIFKKMNSYLDNNKYEVVKYPKSWTVQTDKNILLKHKLCGNEWYTSPKKIYDGIGCPECFGLGLWQDRDLSKVTLEEVIQRIKDTDDEYEYVSGFKNMSTNFKLRHKTCGTEWNVKPYSFLGIRKTKCPNCANLYARKWEKDVKERLLHFVDTEIIIDHKIYTNPDNRRYRVEFDLYIPEYNLAIELDGNIFHSTLYKDEKTARTHMLDKTLFAAENGIKLVHFYWDEWSTEEKRMIIISRILSYMGVFPEGTYHGRKCYVSEVEPQITRVFYNDNHLQGFAQSSVHLGLIDKDTDILLSMMSFGYRKISNNYEYELIRFCSAVGTKVHGAANKLFKHFINNYSSHYSGYDRIISYADLRFSSHPDYFLDDLVYTKLGFDFEGISKPSYYYTKANDMRETRYKYQKHKLPQLFDGIDMNKSETEIMKEQGYGRLYNCGNAKFSYNVN